MSSTANAQDPHEVLQASIRYQKSQSLDRQGDQAFGSRTMREARRCCSLPIPSLYPSLETVHHAAGDAIDLERNWENAAVSGRNRPSGTEMPPETNRTQVSTCATDHPRTSNQTDNFLEVRANIGSAYASVASSEAARGDHFFIPREVAHDHSHDDEILAMKLAANSYDSDLSRRLSSRLEVNASSVTAVSAEVEAEATVVDMEGIHPMEAQSVVQAELVYQGENIQNRLIEANHQHQSHPEPYGQVQCQPGTAFEARSEIRDSLVSLCEPANIGEEIPTEATVIESGDPEKATIAAWSGHTTQAVVLQQENSVNPFGSIDDLDTKCPPLPVENNVTVATPQPDGRGDGRDVSLDNSAIATVVNYNIHPSEMTNESVQAEFMGSSSTAVLVPNDFNGVSSSANYEIHETEQPTEATVLDSGPPEKATVDAWSRGTGEAHVLQEHYDQQVDGEDQIANVEERTATIPHNGVEIIDISNEFHPAEVEIEGAATAELVETSFGDSSNNRTTSVSSVALMGQNVNEPDTTDTGVVTPATVLAIDNVSRMEDSYVNLEKRHISYGSRAPGDSRNTSYTEENSVHTESLTMGDASDEQFIPLVYEGTTATPMMPPPRPFSSNANLSTGTNRKASRSSSRSDSLTNNLTRGTNNVMEILFGNSRPCAIMSRKPFKMDSFTTFVSPRVLLPSSVIYNEHSESWVATINTNQKALDNKNVNESSKALRAFSVPTKKQAMCLAMAWSPPRMYSFEENPQCFICQHQFAVFRRPCHCRNCGVCVCNSCSVQWPSKMLPETYNIKKEDIVNICNACDWLCSAFRRALQQGDCDKAIALHATGNVNLTTPFANIKGEVFYPVHCAIQGGSLQLLKWLVEENCCPLKSIRVGAGSKKYKSHGQNDNYTPILTSKGRSLLNIALSNNSIDIVRYLVVEKGMLFRDEKDIPLDIMAQNFELILRLLPTESDFQKLPSQSFTPPFSSTLPQLNTANAKTTSYSSDVGCESTQSITDDESDLCIICCSNQIDCVVTPCGHQMCCLECSKNISQCPVCMTDCSFLKVYRAK